jgi:hypothetical protein
MLLTKTMMKPPSKPLQSRARRYFAFFSKFVLEFGRENQTTTIIQGGKIDFFFLGVGLVIPTFSFFI